MKIGYGWLIVGSILVYALMVHGQESLAAGQFDNLLVVLVGAPIFLLTLFVKKSPEGTKKLPFEQAPKAAAATQKAAGSNLLLWAMIGLVIVGVFGGRMGVI